MSRDERKRERSGEGQTEMIAIGSRDGAAVAGPRRHSPVPGDGAGDEERLGRPASFSRTI